MHTSGGASVVADDTMTVGPNSASAFGAHINISGTAFWDGYRKTLGGNLAPSTLEEGGGYTAGADETGLLVFHMILHPADMPGSIDSVEATDTVNSTTEKETAVFDLKYDFGYGPDCTL